MTLPVPAAWMAAVSAALLSGVIPGCSPAAENRPAEPAPAPNVCAECHAEQVRFHAYGAHAEVTCAQCHGVEGDHTRTDAAIEMPGNPECLVCHPLDGEGSSRLDPFERHLRWVEEKHVIQVDRRKVDGRCVSCHDPHLGE